MRYLKTFESLDKFTTGTYEIENFIKNNLAYILDEGFSYKVNFKFYGGRMNYIVKIHKIEESTSQYGVRETKQVIFNWNNIKDDFMIYLRRSLVLDLDLVVYLLQNFLLLHLHMV